MDKFLEKLFSYCDISKENMDVVINTFFKYKDNKIVEALCNHINTNLKANKGLLDIANELGLSIAYPTLFITLHPSSPTLLRVYTNIPIDSVPTEVSTMSCTNVLKTFLSEYEADMLDEKKKLKWATLERAITRFEVYVDLPTSAVVARYLFPTKSSDEVRNIANRIDNVRKPMELIYADTPEDYVTMYGSGPHSCMAFSGEGKENWKFFKEYNLCPASWYAYYPNTRGAYVLKADKVLARVMLFLDDGKWRYGRIYPIPGANIREKFVETLQAQGITELKGNHRPTPGISFTIPGVLIKDNNYGCPWPYFDDIPREPSDWGISFNKETKEFTIQYKPTKLASYYNRTGHIQSIDYESIVCVLPKSTL